MRTRVGEEEAQVAERRLVRPSDRGRFDEGEGPSGTSETRRTPESGRHARTARTHARTAAGTAWMATCTARFKPRQRLPSGAVCPAGASERRH